MQYAPQIAAAALVTALASWFAVKALAQLPVKSWLPFPLFAVGPVAMALAVWNKVQLFDERYLIAASPFVYLFIAAGADAMWSAAKERRTRLLAASAATIYLMLLVTSGWSYYFSPRHGREQWREAVDWVNSRRAPARNSLVILDPMYLHYPWDYYQRNWSPIDTLLLTNSIRKDFLASTASARRMIDGYETVWLILSHQPDDSAARILRTLLHEDGLKFYPKSNGIEIFQFSAAH
jgi:hypothetical protein